jgi:cell division protein FtsZ
VEHIPEFAPERTIELSRPAAEVYGAIDIRGAVQGAGQAAAAAKESAPELLPVRASVFDDDFFRRPKDELSAKAAEEVASRQWSDPRVPSFAGYAGESTADNDELDIPAFLRRKQ